MCYDSDSVKNVYPTYWLGITVKLIDSTAVCLFSVLHLDVRINLVVPWVSIVPFKNTVPTRNSCENIVVTIVDK